MTKGRGQGRDLDLGDTPVSPGSGCAPLGCPALRRAALALLGGMRDRPAPAPGPAPGSWFVADQRSVRLSLRHLSPLSGPAPQLI